MYFVFESVAVKLRSGTKLCPDVEDRAFEMLVQATPDHLLLAVFLDSQYRTVYL
jgi:hypothetical protein